MRNALRRAKNVDPTDLAQEISLARARIFEVLRLEPENHDVLMKCMDVLRKMIAAHYEMSHEEERDFGGALRELVAELMPGD